MYRRRERGKRSNLTAGVMRRRSRRRRLERTFSLYIYLSHSTHIFHSLYILLKTKIVNLKNSNENVEYTGRLRSSSI